MKFGIIGGSGLYKMEDLTQVKLKSIETPFGDPSDKFILGSLAGKDVVFLPRHGQGHTILPSEINYRANIWGMKSLGVTHLVSISAVGSLKLEIEPGHIVIPDQFIDRTQNRASTFFGNGIAAHLPFGNPVCKILSDQIIQAVQKVGVTVHQGGTYVCMEGPMFSTRAESEMYRSLGASVIGMTNLQEAKLAREAELCFSTIALSTDYDCWHESEEDVSVEMVLETVHKNVHNTQLILKELLSTYEPGSAPCVDQSALQGAIMTTPEMIPAETKEKLSLLIRKYI